MKLQFPYQINSLGRTATIADMDGFVRDVIEDVLFTRQGERVNLPSYGSGLEQMVFEPLSEGLTASAEMVIQANLMKWLTNYIDLQAVRVTNDDGKLLIKVTYALLADQKVRELQLQREAAS